MQVIDSLHIGGAERAVALLASGLDRSRFDVAVRCTNGLGVLADQLIAQSIDVQLAGAPTRRQRYFTPWYLWRVVRRWQADVVHTHGLPGLLHAGPLAALGVAPPWVHTFHYGNYPLDNAKEAWAERLFARTADQLVAVSDAQRRAIVADYGFKPDAMTTVINGVDASRVAVDAEARASRRREFGFEPGHIVVGCVAVLTRQKGITHLIQAARQIASADPRVRFLIAGGGPLEDSLRSEARSLGLDGLLVFTGWRQDNLELLSALDIFVMSSLWEAMPLALLEAMSARRPIVVTDVGDNRMVVDGGACGRLVPSGDAGAIVDAVRALIADPEQAAAMAERAHARFLARFTSSQMVGQYEAIYERLVRPRLPASPH